MENLLNKTIELNFATINDISTIQEIAAKSWLKTYKNIIPKTQIYYMLGMMYNTQILTDNIQNNKPFLLIKQRNKTYGFASYEINYDQKNNCKLHKLYILPNTKGKGFGKLLLQEVIEIAKKNIQKNIFLNVNKQNKTYEYYLKNNFKIYEETILQIGNKYIMDDYIMVLKLNNPV